LSAVRAINRCAQIDGIRVRSSHRESSSSPNRGAVAGAGRDRQVALPTHLPGQSQVAAATGLSLVTTASPPLVAETGSPPACLSWPDVDDAHAHPESAGLHVMIDHVRRRVVVTGELDSATGPTVCDAMSALLLNSPGDATIDLAGVRFLGAAGIGALVECANQLNSLGATLYIVGVRPRLRRIFDIVGLTSMLNDSP
jgi:anti-sigma B factor antagonist